MDAVRLCIFLLQFFNIMGTWFIDKPNDENEQVKLLHDTLCFRVVTRGIYPDLIKKTINVNLEIIKKYKDLRYTYEIVTDNKVSFDPIKKCYEIIVPSSYETQTDAKFKVRALQYAIEQNISQLGDSDWVIHLDEETLITKSSMIGIFKFVNNSKHSIRQGAITYDKNKVVHMPSSLADCIRVSQDLGTFRYSLKYLHRPMFFFKGSFIACKHGVEAKVSLDHGFEGSITEDSYFAVKAANEGYTFDWIEGEMEEKSPFNLMDFLRQRRR